MPTEEGITPHQCIDPDCDKIVQFDDEPWCFEHSPDEGSSLAGWSAKELLQQGAQNMIIKNGIQHNVFKEGRDG